MQSSSSTKGSSCSASAHPPPESSKRSKRINVEGWKMYKKNASPEDGSVQEPASQEPDEDQEMVWDLLDKPPDRNRPPPPPPAVETPPAAAASATTVGARGREASSFSQSRRRMTNSGLGESIMSGERRLFRGATLFTVMSYNVLADELMRRHRNDLYRNIEESFLSWEQRYPRILSEIRSWSPDVLCMQEVERDHFEANLQPDLADLGYGAVYKKRTAEKNDGCAIFYKTEKFTLADWTSVEYHQPHIDVLNRDNVALMVKLSPVNKGHHRHNHQSQSVAVSTTHLLYNPKRDDVRLAQAVLMMAELDRFCTEETRPYSRLPCVVTGDFNSQPGSLLHAFLAGGAVDYAGLFRQRPYGGRGCGPLPLLPRELGITSQCQHYDTVVARGRGTPPSGWPSRLADSERGIKPGYIKQEKSDDFMEDVRLSFEHDFGLRSAYRHRPGMGTTFQKGWVTVDYLFYSTVRDRRDPNRFVEGDLKLLSRLEVLSAEEMSPAVALPDGEFPSDHIPLLAKFALL